MAQSISPALLQQVQDRCKMLRKHDVSPQSATTPDGQTTLTCSSTYGGCGSSSASWISTTGPDGQEKFRKTTKDVYDKYQACAITADGSYGYVAQHDKRGDSVVGYRLTSNFLNFGNKVLDGKVSALTVAPDGRLIMGHPDGSLVALPPQGWFGKLLTVTAPTPIGTVNEEIRALATTEDGSLLVMPRDWEKHLYVIPVGQQAPIKIPLKTYDPDAWGRTVEQNARFLKDGQGAALASHATDWLADDEGTCKKHRAAWRQDGKQAAVITQESNGTVACWTWDPASGAPQALPPLPGVTELGARSEVSYADDNTLTVKLGSWGRWDGEHLIDLKTGKSTQLPMAALSLARHGDVVAAVTPKGLWTWNAQQDKTQMSLPLAAGTPLGSPTLSFSDNGTMVYTHPTPGAPNGSTIELLDGNGKWLSSVPCAQDVKVSGNRVTFKLGDHPIEVKLPDDVATITKQPWYQNVSAGMLFGQPKDSGPVKGVDDDGPTVQIGNVAIPNG